MADGIVLQTVNAMIATLNAIPALNTKVFPVLTEEELLEISGAIPVPCAGVVYEGMRSRSDSGSAHKPGLVSDLTLLIIIFYKNRHPLGKQQADVFKNEALALLDNIRTAVKDTIGPSAKFWRFLGEAPAMERNGVVVWGQRWSLPVNT